MLDIPEISSLHKEIFKKFCSLEVPCREKKNWRKSKPYQYNSSGNLDHGYVQKNNIHGMQWPLRQVIFQISSESMISVAFGDFVMM